MYARLPHRKREPSEPACFGWAQSRRAAQPAALAHVRATSRTRLCTSQTHTSCHACVPPPQTRTPHTAHRRTHTNRVAHACTCVHVYLARNIFLLCLYPDVQFQVGLEYLDITIKSADTNFERYCDGVYRHHEQGGLCGQRLPLYTKSDILIGEPVV